MDNYLIHYKTKEGDYSKCHEDADSPEEAESQARSEYWDIDEIISIQKHSLIKHILIILNKWIKV